MNAILALEDGSVYRGAGFGGVATTCGEVCFNTSMTGYQEILTDPSYTAQIVTMTYPLIGNYGVNTQDIESYNLEFRDLQRQLYDMSQMTFNGVSIFAFADP